MSHIYPRVENVLYPTLVHRNEGCRDRFRVLYHVRRFRVCNLLRRSVASVERSTVTS